MNIALEHENVIALGSNLGSAAGGRAQTVRAALGELHRRGLPIRRVSRFFRTPCFPAGAGPDYVNACAVLGGDLPAGEVLTRLHEVEAHFDRQRVSRWGSRTLDLDLLGIGDRVLPDAQTHARWRELPLDAQKTEAPEQLILPHPRLHERAFVLVPLCDVAPNWRHPTLGLSVRAMTEALAPAARAEVVPM